MRFVVECKAELQHLSYECVYYTAVRFGGAYLGCSSKLFKETQQCGKWMDKWDIAT